MHHFVINLVKIIAHQMQDFQLDKHQKTFGGRAPPDPLAAKRGPTSTGRGGEGEGRDPPRVGGHPHFQILKNTLCRSIFTKQSNCTVNKSYSIRCKCPVRL